MLSNSQLAIGVAIGTGLPPTPGSGGPAWRRLVGAARIVRAKVEDWRAARRLMGADDAMFKDIGVARGNIDWAVRHGRSERTPAATGDSVKMH